ncbi:hypothetical protein LCGC14_0871820, partial [marine sediment metagenome]
MSADNGIFLLKSPLYVGKIREEYRVIHAQAIDNLDWEVPEGWDYNPEQLVAYFGKCKVLTEKEAQNEASRLYEEYAVPICEYGIVELNMTERPFSAYVQYTKEQSNVQELACGKFLRLVKKGHWEYAERVNTKEAAIIIAITNDNKLLFVEQFRIPLDCKVIEMPAGLVGDIRSGESAEDAARTELLEETGYKAKNIEFLVKGPKSPGMSNEEASLFLATDLTKIKEGGGDNSENI